jgi:hypothetical protein
VSPHTAARIFALLTGVVVLFQLALTIGAPWGRYAMGGAFPGTYPPAMRVAALVQAAVLAGVAAVILARARRSSRLGLRVSAWIVVALLAAAVVLNLITPSPLERLIWAPVAIALFATALRVALSR